jgi:spermidine synthase
LFLASGATGLVDQLCFSKYLSYIVGSTAHAISAVLAAFMAGLALGAHWGGKLTRRVERPLLVYGILELVVAAAVALSPLAFGALTPLYVLLARALPESLATLSVVRWLVAMGLVIVPTVAMGATLPLLTRAVELSADPGARKQRLGALYAINTFGGASGALASAYFILPSLGIAKTLLASALASALIGGVAILVGRKPEPAGTRERAELREADGAMAAEEPPARERLLLHALAFGSGWLVFACEVVFTHLLALIIGNSAYAFGLILASFLCCLCLGAAQAPRVHHKRGPESLAISLAVTGAALAATLPLWDWLPLIFQGSGEVVESFAGREAVRGLVAFGTLLVPTTLMGLTFPLLLQRAAAFTHPGQWVGRLTAFNTLGAVVGSLMTGYVILPVLGSQRCLIAVALAFAVGGVLTLRSSGRRARSSVLALAAATALLAVLIPRWDLARLTSGTNVYFEGHKEPATLLMMREDVHGGVTTVARREGVDTLYTNGKFQGNTGWEMRAQRLLAHYPCLFVPSFHRALVIGLGTGTTLGTFTGYPWQELKVVEISPSITEAARRYFRKPNRGALDDPRVAVEHADGRNYLLVSDERYSLIAMELSSIWFAGAANLYSREYYALVRRHLEADGIFQQWVQLHHVRRRDFATILHTLRMEFPHVALFYGGGQGILVASEKPLRASLSRLSALERRPDVIETLPEKSSLSSLLEDVLVEGDALDRFLAESARAVGAPLAALVSTDDNLYLEYATPRGNILPWSAREALVADLKRFRDPEAIARLLAP